jgi:hypothetical protein
MSAEIVEKQDAELLIQAFLDGLIDFAGAIAGADQVEGGDVWKGDRLDQLTGVPFVIVGGTFREGYLRDGKSTDYVSLECVVADADTLAKKAVKMEGKDFAPKQIVRINDGGTGIRRQIVSYLHQRGYISVAKGDIIEVGKLGESSFDLPVSAWDDYSIGSLTFDNDGGTIYDFVIPGLLYAPRGVRSSTYKSDITGQNVTTRYLA